MLDTADICAVMQPMDIRSGMPGGTGSQLIPFKQNDIRPSQFSQMVEDRAADYSAADYNSLGMRSHNIRLSK